MLHNSFRKNNRRSNRHSHGLLFFSLCYHQEQQIPRLQAPWGFHASAVFCNSSKYPKEIRKTILRFRKKRHMNIYVFAPRYAASFFFTVLHGHVAFQTSNLLVLAYSANLTWTVIRKYLWDHIRIYEADCDQIYSVYPLLIFSFIRDLSSAV